MRLVAFLALALSLGACTRAPLGAGTQSPPASAGPVSPSPSATLPSATPAPTPSRSLEPSFVDLALAYASRAGFELAPDPEPAVSDQEPSFDWLMLHRVSLLLAGADGAALNVYLDDDGAILVVEDEFHRRPQGAVASRREVLRAADRHLREAGVDPQTGTLHVASGKPGQHWYLTFDREIAGYLVANAPMAWWIHGDKAYLDLRPDASLVELYAIRPDHLPVPTILDRDELEARLADAAEVSRSKLRLFEPVMVWARARDPGPRSMREQLSLNYCATERLSYGWNAWCVDAATGELSLAGGAWD